MRNLLWAFLRKGLVILAIMAYWILDDLVFFLPDTIVDWISGQVFKATANGYRFDEFKTFWNKKPPASPAIK